MIKKKKNYNCCAYFYKLSSLMFLDSSAATKIVSRYMQFKKFQRAVEVLLLHCQMAEA